MDIYLTFNSHKDFSLLFFDAFGNFEVYSGEYLDCSPGRHAISCVYYGKELSVVAEGSPSKRKGIRRFFVPRILDGKISLENEEVATFQLARFGSQPYLALRNQLSKFNVVVEKQQPRSVVSPLIVRGIPGVSGFFNQKRQDVTEEMLRLPKPFGKSGWSIGRYCRCDVNVDSEVKIVELSVAIICGLIIIPEFMGSDCG